MSGLFGMSPGDWKKQFDMFKEDIKDHDLNTLKKENSAEFNILKDTMHMLYEQGLKILEKNPKIPYGDKLMIIMGILDILKIMKNIGLTN